MIQNVKLFGKNFLSILVIICMKAKSLYKSRAGRHFYGTENEIWAGFGNTEKKWGAD
jgi:hypothetical protein